MEDNDKTTELAGRVANLEQEVAKLNQAVNDPAWAKKRFASLGGSVKSEAKARAARENGKKGWPLPKKAVQP